MITLKQSYFSSLVYLLIVAVLGFLLRKFHSRSAILRSDQRIQVRSSCTFASRAFRLGLLRPDKLYSLFLYSKTGFSKPLFQNILGDADLLDRDACLN